MKRIIVTTNFSSHSKYTVEYVVNFLNATQIPCSILLVNTFMVQQTDPDQVILANDQLKQLSRQKLELERLEALKLITNSNISVETSSNMGSLNYVILNLIQKEKFDLVAMGKNGGRHVEAMSTMLKTKKCPLLITYMH